MFKSSRFMYGRQREVCSDRIASLTSGVLVSCFWLLERQICESQEFRVSETDRVVGTHTLEDD